MEIWSYCLMPNHVHVIAVPKDQDGLSRAFRYVHRHYTGYINARLRVTGHLWQGRFCSVAMDEPHFVTALRYVALNPVPAAWCIGRRTGNGQARARWLRAWTTMWLKPPRLRSGGRRQNTVT